MAFVGARGIQNTWTGEMSALRLVAGVAPKARGAANQCDRPQGRAQGNSDDECGLWEGKDTMNAEMFRRIADQIEKEPERYDQNIYGWNCDSPHCIAGWALVFSGKQHSDVLRPSQKAAEILGINDREMRTLFIESWTPIRGLTVPDALRQIADGASVASVSR